MRENEYIKIIISLSEGVDPFTGEIFPTQSLYQQPDVIRALLYAVHRLKPKQQPLKARHGQAWSPDEENKIAEAFKSGSTISTIANQQQRSRGSIEARLAHLGLIENYIPRRT